MALIKQQVLIFILLATVFSCDSVEEKQLRNFDQNDIKIRDNISQWDSLMDSMIKHNIKYGENDSL
ncbi:hypothetical protein FEZ18_02430 [Oceanihabitans sp. IOP_32]|uniref:hypothetical protein n=1 Tax=Oceanihabitans sp. IOP_32 TaxID=2529032 RepID=UPI0012931D7E|nr:hypothetical protein [Oceanihabitans sp. IOP_32]QFZ53743.1 hypothetical protein FEZ18_02430 [Oceanihabitans sp. IOP_32]